MTFASTISLADYTPVSDYWSVYGTSLSTELRLYKNISLVADDYKAFRPKMPTIVYPWFSIIKTLQLVSEIKFSEITSLLFSKK